MNLAPINPGDIVLIDKRGHRFHALATEAGVNGELRFRPIDPRTTWRHATAREVIAHPRKSTSSRA